MKDKVDFIRGYKRLLHAVSNAEKTMLKLVKATDNINGYLHKEKKMDVSIDKLYDHYHEAHAQAVEAMGELEDAAGDFKAWMRGSVKSVFQEWLTCDVHGVVKLREKMEFAVKSAGEHKI